MLAQLEYLLDRAAEETRHLEQLDRFTISPALLRHTHVKAAR